MRREVFQFREVINKFLKVGSTLKLEALHTFTYCTAAAAGGSSDQLPMAEVGGFLNGQTIRIGLNVAVTITAGLAVADKGPKTVTISVAQSFSNNDTIARDQTATLFDDPDLATSITQPITLDENNETPFFPQAGPVAERIFDGAGNTLRLVHNDAFRELDWATVHPEHGSTTGGILEAVRSLSSAGGTVYVPAGTKLPTAKILIETNNIRILGAGRGKTVVKQANSTNLLGPGGLFELASGVTGFEIADLTIDGNSDNNTTSTVYGIFLNNNTDVEMHDINIINVRSKGIGNAASANPLTRCNVRNSFLTNIGNAGIELFFAVGCRVTENDIFRTNGHGVSLSAGTSQDTDFSKFCQVNDNLVDRSAAASTAEVSFQGSLLNIGGGTDSSQFIDNILNDNSTQSANAPGISWDHTASGRVWRNNRIEGNIVLLADTIGIDAISSTGVKDNIIVLCGTHGLRFSPGGAPASFDRTPVCHNLIIDANDDNVTATRVHGISLNFDSSSKAMSNLLFDGNMVVDTRDTKRLLYAMGIVKASGVAGETLTNILVTNNDFKGVETAAVDWAGDGTTDVPLADGTVTGFRWRNNLTKDAYSGEVTLVAGVSGTQAQNTAWPPFTNLLFNISRTDINASTLVGALEGKYDGTDTLVISAFGRGTFQTSDPSVGASRADAPTLRANDELMNVMSTISTVSVHSVAQQEAPGALTVDRMLLRTADVTNPTSIDIHLEDSEATPNILTVAKTILSVSDDNTWHELLGSGVAAVSGSLLHLRATNEVGDITNLEVDEIIIVWNAATIAATGDISKVFWEFLGTKD